MVLILLTVDWTSQECHAGEFAEAEQSEKGGTENYTVNHHVIHARSSRDEKHRAIRTGQSIPQSRKENENLPTPLSIQGLKRQLTGAGQFLDGLSRRVNTASLPADRTQATLNMGKVPTPSTVHRWDPSARGLWNALSRWPAGKAHSDIRLFNQIK